MRILLHFPYNIINIRGEKSPIAFLYFYIFGRRLCEWEYKDTQSSLKMSENQILIKRFWAEGTGCVGRCSGYIESRDET